MIIFEDENFTIEPEKHELPWLKIFPKEPYKELTDMPLSLQCQMWQIYNAIEKEMLNYFQPDKINMASFGNMLPRVHIHIIARFQNDAYFPNPVWGEQLRKSSLKLPDFSNFYKRVATLLEQKEPVHSPK